MTRSDTSRMSFKRDKPYNELPDLALSLAFLAEPNIQRQVIDAHRALAELKGASLSLPNPDLLLESVTLQEGKDSSEIENIVTTQDELYRAAAEQRSRSTARLSTPAKEVLRYREATYAAWNRVREQGTLTTNTLLEIVQILTENQAGVRSHEVIVGNRVTGEVVYTPPLGEELIRTKLRALETFLHGDSEIDDLVRMALGHYQFEAIHPFPDGNGRTGRILNVLFLIQRGLLDSPILYLSAYFLRYRSQYYSLLRRVTEESAWSEWTSFVLRGVRLTAKATLDLIRDVNELMHETADRAKAEMKNGYSLELIHLLFVHPYCKIQFLVDAKIASRATASNYLSDLVRLSILEKVQIHRNKYFINRKLLDRLKQPRV